MSDNSYPNNQACIEMWREAVLDGQQRMDNQRTAQRRRPSAPSDSDGVRSPSALSDSDAPPPSALSDDDTRPPSALSSGVGSFRHATPLWTTAGEESQGVLDHGHSGQDGGCHEREPCSRASFSSTLAENGSAFCLASERAVQYVVGRERVQNNMVQGAIQAAESSLARLRRLVASFRGAGLQEEEIGVSDSIAQERTAPRAALGHIRVKFTVGHHPEHKNPIRPGTPRVLPVCLEDYFGDDEKERPTASRRRRSRRSLVPPPPTPDSLQSPVKYVLRALASSEVWDEEVPSEPVLFAPVPLRPLVLRDLLHEGDNYESAHGGST